MRVHAIGDGWFPDRPGGLNRYFRSLLDELHTGGDDVTGVVVGPATDAPPNVTVASSRDRSLARRMLAVARAGSSSAALLDVHFALYGLVPALVAHARGRPTVVHFHGPWADESVAAGTSSSAEGVVKRLIERAVYRRADALVTLSEAFKHVLVGRYGVAPWRVNVIPPGVDLDRYRPGEQTIARRPWNVAADAWLAVCVRRLVPRMGIDLLLEAWAEARPEQGILLIAGEGEERLRLATMINHLELDGSVRLLGEVDERLLPDLYRAADVSIVPSRGLEGFGLSVLESLAVGTPVITTDAGGLPEATRGLEPSLVVPANDVGALGRAIRQARLGQTPTRESCRSHAELFTWRASCDRHRDIYRLAANGSSEPRRLRVVYLSHTASLSGAELALARLLPALRDRVDAHVILAEDGPLAARLAAADLSVEVLPMLESVRGRRRDAIGVSAFPGAALYTLRVARRLRELRPDLVHTNSLKAALYGSAAAKLARVPCVWHARDRVEDDYLPRRMVSIVRAAARTFPAVVVANSRTTLATLPGVTPAYVVPSPIEQVQCAAPRDFSGPLRVGMLGRIAPWKGQHVFVEAFAEAFADSGDTAVLIGTAMFGDDELDYLEKMKRRVRDLGLEDRVTFAGFRDDVQSELATLDILVHASVRSEPFGQVVLEGMASGLPVIATAAGGPSEFIADGEEGLLVAPGDVGALAGAMRRLRDDPELRLALGAAGRQRATAFAPAEVANAMLTVYRRALEGGE